MKLLSDSQFDIREYFGELVMIYPESLAEKVGEITALLDVSGHVYHSIPLGEAILTDRTFMDDVIEKLGGCACFVPVMSEDLTSSEHAFYRTLLWHFIGYVRASYADAIVPYVPKGECVSLAGTPMQDLDIMTTPDELMETLLGKYSSRLLRNNYYKNRTTNLYAAKRIQYHCLRLRFNIHDECFDNARELLYYYTSQQMDNDAEFDKYLEENLVAGCKIISFGSDERLEPQMMAYKEEVHPDIDSLPKTLIGKKSYRKLTGEEKREAAGVHAEVTVDLLIPVHKLLGTYLKPYVKCLDKDCPVEVVAALMESDLTGGAATPYDEIGDGADFWLERLPETAFIDTEKKRLYFGLDFEKPENPIVPDPALCVGRFLNYVYPQ